MGITTLHITDETRRGWAQRLSDLLGCRVEAVPSASRITIERVPNDRADTSLEEPNGVNHGNFLIFSRDESHARNIQLAMLPAIGEKPARELPPMRSVLRGNREKTGLPQLWEAVPELPLKSGWSHAIKERWDYPSGWAQVAAGRLSAIESIPITKEQVQHGGLLYLNLGERPEAFLEKLESMKDAVRNYATQGLKGDHAYSVPKSSWRGHVRRSQSETDRGNSPDGL